jgi:GNAT superfamily N-acetyltransferase
MTTPEMRVVNTPNHNDVHFLGDRLAEFNARTTGHDDGHELAIFLRDDATQIVGRVYGWTWAGWLEIRYLWVHESLRHQGYGRAMLQAAEQEAQARGCSRVLLDTFSFQAPEFYQRLGYVEVANLEDFPAPHRRTYFMKSIGP